MIILDLDHFKSINDNYGHAAGDEVLKYFAERMKKAVHEQDICFRFGGEEFIILLPNTAAREAYTMAERLRETLEKNDSPLGRPVTISAGVASFPEMAANSTDLLDLADKALYEAKKAGRNCVILYKH